MNHSTTHYHNHDHYEERHELAHRGRKNTEKQVAPSDNQYRYDRFTTSLLFSDLTFRKGGLGPGDSLPAFEVVSTAGDRLTNPDLTGDKPLLLIFGSVTCPMTASAMPSLRLLHA
jgi:hypothetical protein